MVLLGTPASEARGLLVLVTKLAQVPHAPSDKSGEQLEVRMIPPLESPLWIQVVTGKKSLKSSKLAINLLAKSIEASYQRLQHLATHCSADYFGMVSALVIQT
jgi:hypothetical protein